MSHILTIDQGTTGTTVSLINKQGEITATYDQDFPQIFPQPGWVEHDPEAIWKTVTNGIEALFKKNPKEFKSIQGIGITNQRETVIAWDKSSGRPLYNAIVWQCRRTTRYCQDLKKKGKEKVIRSKTGLVLDPYFSASKMNWLLKNVPAVKEAQKNKQLLFGTIESFLTYRLTGGESHVSDVSNASRTLLLNIKTLKWDSELLRVFGVPAEALPEVVGTSEVVGQTRGLKVLPDGIPIAGMIGDQQSALFGQSCFKEGESKITFGTGSFMLMNTGQKIVRSRYGLLSTVAWKTSEKVVYALEGGAFVCGAAVQWLRDQLQILTTSAEIEKWANEVLDSGGVQVVPALSGLGAPHWNPEARGALMGLTRGTSRGHICRATLESLALQNADILFAMQKDLGKKIKSIRVDGGASANALLMQLQANFLQTSVERPANVESTTMGAAFSAGLAVGLWKDLAEIKKLTQQSTVYKPRINARELRLAQTQWSRALKAVSVFAHSPTKS